MAKRDFKRPPDGDPKVNAPKVDEALRNVRPAVDADKVPAAGQTAHAPSGAETGDAASGAPTLPTQSIETSEQLADRLVPGNLDARDAPEEDDSGGLASPLTGRDSLRGRPQVSGLFDTAESDETATPGRDSSMISEGFGDLVDKATTFVTEGETDSSDFGSHRIHTKDGELVSTPGEEAVNKSIGSGFTQTMGGVENLLWAERAIDSTGRGSSGGSGGTADSQAGTTGTGGSTGSSDTGATGTEQGESTVEQEYDNEDGSHTTVYSNGDIVTTYPDGTVEHNYADGTVETDYPDGTMKTEYPDGTVEIIHPDGTIETTEPPDSDESTSEEDAEDPEASETDTSETEGTGSDDATADTPETSTDEEAWLPDDIKSSIAADIASMREQLQPRGGGDGVTDPDPNADPAVPAAGGSALDAPVKLKGMLGQPPDDGPAFGAGRSVGAVPQPGAGAIDPGRDADPVVQTTGPEERDTRHDITGLSPPSGGSDAGDEPAEDTTGGLGAITGLTPTTRPIDGVELAAADGDDSPDDAD